MSKIIKGSPEFQDLVRQVVFDPEMMILPKMKHGISHLPRLPGPLPSSVRVVIDKFETEELKQVEKYAREIGLLSSTGHDVSLDSLWKEFIVMKYVAGREGLEVGINQLVVVVVLPTQPNAQVRSREEFATPSGFETAGATRTSKQVNESGRDMDTKQAVSVGTAPSQKHSFELVVDTPLAPNTDFISHREVLEVYPGDIVVVAGGGSGVDGGDSGKTMRDLFGLVKLYRTKRQPGVEASR